MKKLLLSILASLALCASAAAQCVGTYATPIDNIITTNICLRGTLPTSYNWLGQGFAEMANGNGPLYTFKQTFGSTTATNSFWYVGASLPGVGIQWDGNMTIGGNLSVIGTNNTLWQTNGVYAALFATNAPDGNQIVSTAMLSWGTNASGGLYNLQPADTLVTVGPNACVMFGGPNNYSWAADSGVIIGGILNTNYGGGTGSTISGGAVNKLFGASYAVIAGGGQNQIWSGVPSFYCSIGGGDYNTIGNSSSSSVICGGTSNVITTSTSSSIGGGLYNQVISASGSHIGGGTNNTIQGPMSLIGGGDKNVVLPSADWAVVGGGHSNSVAGWYSTVSGGTDNAAVGALSTIPGGNANRAGDNAFASGSGAWATNQGSFVWADSTGGIYGSTADNIVQFRAQSGLKLDGGPFQGNGIALTNQIVGPTPIANQCILWYSNTVLWATGPNSTKPVLTGL